jgi:DNA-binding CsgD family transcriptional regulator
MLQVQENRQRRPVSMAGLTEKAFRRKIAGVPELGEPYTKAEAKVARWLARGRTLEQTAGQLRLSVNTVKTHTKRVYRKLGVHSQVRLICKTYGIR